MITPHRLPLSLRKICSLLSVDLLQPAQTKKLPVSMRTRDTLPGKDTADTTSEHHQIVNGYNGLEMK